MTLAVLNKFWNSPYVEIEKKLSEQFFPWRTVFMGLLVFDRNNPIYTLMFEINVNVTDDWQLRVFGVIWRPIDQYQQFLEFNPIKSDFCGSPSISKFYCSSKNSKFWKIMLILVYWGWIKCLHLKCLSNILTCCKLPPATGTYTTLLEEATTR